MNGSMIDCRCARNELLILKIYDKKMRHLKSALVNAIENIHSWILTAQYNLIYSKVVGYELAEQWTEPNFMVNLC